MTPYRAVNRSPLSCAGMAAFGTALLVAAVAFTLWPEIDLWAARAFWRPGAGFHLADSAYARLWYHGVTLVRNWIVYPAAAVLLLWWLVRARLPLGIPPRAAVLVAGTLAVGSGLLVNAGLKEHWGRARPRDIERFDGEREFTPALVPADQCADNCSFVSGHTAFVFGFLSLALLARRRGRAIALVAVLGAGAGLGRMMQGGHFLSDVVFSGLFLFGVAWALHRLLYRGVTPARSPAST